MLSSGGLIDDSGTPLSHALPFMFFVLARGVVAVVVVGMDFAVPSVL